MANKHSHLTRVVSYLHRHSFLDEDCFEDGEITEDDYLEGDDGMNETRKEKLQEKMISAMSIAMIVGGTVAFFMFACSAVYYGTKGTVGLFKAIGKVGSGLMNR